MDCLVKVWDLPTSKLIDCMRFEHAATSVCFSPTSGEFLATTHVNELGVFLWSNRTLYAHVSLKQLSDDYEPPVALSLAAMPTSSSSSARQRASESNDTAANTLVAETDGDDYDDYKSYVSPEQLAFELITLSLLPESRWKNLINLDIIKVGHILNHFCC